MAYDVGQTYQTYIDVTDDAGTPQVPATAVLTVSWRNPAGAQSSVFALAPAAGQGQLPAPLTVVNGQPGARVFQDWTFTEPALYQFAWVTTGPGAATSDYVPCRNYVAVLPLAQAANWLGVAQREQLPKVRAALALATKLAENVTGPTVPRTYVNDWIAGVERPVLRVPHPPLTSVNAVTSVTAVYPGGPSWSGIQPGDIIVNPRAGTLRLRSGMNWWYGPWLATYESGRAEISADLEGGVLEVLWDLWATQRWIFGDTQEPTMDDVATYESRLPPGYALPQRAMEMFAAEAVPSFG